MLMERAALIMQLESLIHVQHDFAKSAEPETNSHCSKSLWKGAWRIAQVLLTIQIEGSKETSGDYLQVLSNAQSGLHEGVERQALHPPGRVEKMGKKLAGKLDKELNDLKSEVKKQLATQQEQMVKQQEQIAKQIAERVQQMIMPTE